MTRSIDRDLKRFDEIVRGRIRKDLRKYVNHGEMLGRKGRETVSIPVPNIEIPHFRHGQKGSGGAGQGEGEVGQPIGKGQPDPNGTGEAGSEAGSHVREVEISLDELAQMLGNELELPRIEPKGKNTLRSLKDRYTTIGRVGPIRCGTSSGRSRKPSSGRSDQGRTTLYPRRSFPFAKMNASGAGRLNFSRRPTRPSST